MEVVYGYPGLSWMIGLDVYECLWDGMARASNGYPVATVRNEKNFKDDKRKLDEETGDIMVKCVFCGSDGSWARIGGNKGICDTCAEGLASALINTKKVKEESIAIRFGIRSQIQDHELKEHKRT